jgi:O-acetyl-ADP-ribose deacetylase (regulator of RNase III)
MKVRIGNIFDHVKSGVIIHGCNAQGAMGSGVAKDVRARYPAAYELYRAHCEKYGIGSRELLGTIPTWANTTGIIDVRQHLLIVNAITQHRYGHDNYRYVSYKAVQDCFDAIYVMCKALDIEEVHFPAIGSGLGGGDWSIISSIIKDSLQDINSTLWLLDDSME